MKKEECSVSWKQLYTSVKFVSPNFCYCYPHDLLVQSLTQSIVSYYVITYDNILAGSCILSCLDQLIP